MQPDGAGEDAPLDLAAEADEVVDRVAVGDGRHVLVDYGAGVQLLAYVVGCGPDGLDATLVPPRSCARRYGSAPAKAGRKEWWMFMSLSL